MWFRERRSELQAELMSMIYGRSNNLPRWVSIETSGEALAKDRENPAVNVVLYNDEDMLDERNDFFFETLHEAVQFCVNDYSVSPKTWRDVGSWRKVDD